MKKVYTKEQRYVIAMNKAGFLRKFIWVHTDDYQQLKEYAEKLRKKREKN